MSNTPSPQQTQRFTNSSMQREQDASVASSAAPVFTPAFGFEDLEEQDDEVQHQFGHALSLTSPNNEFVFSNNLECYDDDEFAFHDDDKAACMRSVPQRDTAIAFDPMMMRATSEAFMETNVFNGKTPTFVLNTAPLSPTFGEQTFDFLAHLPTISKNTKLPAASPLSPSAYISKIEVPQKERSDFYSVNPVFTSHEAPAKIMDTVKSALATLNCEFEATEAWTLKVNCLLVAELITFSIHVFQLRGMTTKYEIEFVRHSGDELVFADLAEHIRSLCSDVDEEGALSLFSKTLEPWLNDKQELSGRRYAIKEAEALSLVDELNCEHLHVDSLYQVARSIKNHCRHKGNRKLFLQEADTHKEFLKGLKWMLADTEELTRFALFTMLQFAADEDLCSSFFSTPFEKSSFSLQLDALLARDAAPRGLCTKFTSEMVAAVQHSALFA